MRGQKPKPSITTNILADGSKRFTFVVLTERSNKDRKSGNGRNDRGQGRPQRGQNAGESNPSRQRDEQSRTQQGSNNQTADHYQAVREDFLDLLDQHITEAQYCRHGYIELDYSQTQSQTELIGECQESASDADKKRWN